MFLAGSMATSFFVACSPVEFNRSTNNCGGLGESACRVNPDPTYIDFNYPFVAPKPSVDILVVVDNSISMKVEHQKVAERFSSFMNVIDGLEWQLAITTMDISNKYRSGDVIYNSKSYDNPGYAYMEDFQDGNLIPFPNGVTVLKKGDTSLNQAQDYFEQTIQMNSEYFSKGDERGIFTASLAIQKNKDRLIRDHAHLAIIFLTDEDVRGWGTQSEQKDRSYPEDEDIATYLRSTIDNTLGASKGVSVYPIIVQSTNPDIPSVENGGTKNNSYIQACLNTQLQQDRTDAKIGYMYEDLFEFFEGTTASICNSNYTSVLSGIANVIDTQARNSVTLPCLPVIDPERGFDFKILTSLPDGVVDTRDGKTVNFEPALPPDFRVEFSFTCKEI